MDNNGVKILDATCGSRMFWFDKNEPHTTYIDNRSEQCTLCDGRLLQISPDIITDCTHTVFPNNTFSMVVFDPPHLARVGDKAWLRKKYGKLPNDWRRFLLESMTELMRVLKVGGTLIFKWNEQQIKLSEVLSAIEPYQPLFGNRTRTNGNTIWLVFMKFQ
nr:MAG TPA: Methyltransferase small domain [Caudoviricetes sp.]